MTALHFQRKITRTAALGRRGGQDFVAPSDEVGSIGGQSGAVASIVERLRSYTAWTASKSGEEDSMLKQGERGSLDGRRDRWQAAAVGGGAAEREREEEEKRYSAKSAPSDDDWEMVTDSGYHQEGRVPVKVGGVLGQAGDWLQWGIDGAAKSVENTYDGLSG